MHAWQITESGYCHLFRCSSCRFFSILNFIFGGQRNSGRHIHFEFRQTTREFSYRFALFGFNFCPLCAALHFVLIEFTTFKCIFSVEKRGIANFSRRRHFREKSCQKLMITALFIIHWRNLKCQSNFFKLGPFLMVVTCFLMYLYEILIQGS